MRSSKADVPVMQGNMVYVSSSEELFMITESVPNLCDGCGEGGVICLKKYGFNEDSDEVFETDRHLLTTPMNSDGSLLCYDCMQECMEFRVERKKRKT